MFTLLDADREAETEREEVRWRDAMRPKNSQKWLVYVVIVFMTLLRVLVVHGNEGAPVWLVIGAVALLIAVVWLELVLPAIRKRS